MTLPIVKLPTPSLRQRSQEIDRATLMSPEIQQFIQDMIPTMYGDDGIGLASPQVGKNIRICIIGKDAIGSLSRPGDKSWKKTKAEKDMVLVNPVFERISKKTEIDVEGCLSVPKKYGKVKRFRDIKVSGWDENGNDLSFEAHGFFARVIQHEVDHLDGILFIDRAKDVYDVE